MSVEKFVDMMKNEEMKTRHFINAEKVNFIKQRAEELGINKMSYEHQGQALWKHRWNFMSAKSGFVVSNITEKFFK